jgi:hypothetical protein
MVLAYFEGLLLVKMFLFFDHTLFSISPQLKLAAGLTTQWQLGEAGIAMRRQPISQAVILLPGRGV